ncbi:MAG: hypothetical protein HYX97_01115 [Chloroflexi bacterium]|nr:hypothetical protein [Chloroflexota bacterium]
MMAEPDETDLAATWAQAANEALAFLTGESIRAQIVFRFQEQYLPALLRASNSTAVARVWDSFRYYLMVEATWRKPFALSGEEANRVVNALKALSPLPPEEGT